MRPPAAGKCGKLGGPPFALDGPFGPLADPPQPPDPTELVVLTPPTCAASFCAFCGAAATVCAPASDAWAWPWTCAKWSPPKCTSLMARKGAKPPMSRISAPMIVWVIDWVAEALAPGPTDSPSPSVKTPRPMTKMITRTSLETTSATIVSIHLRTHEVEMSAVAPAKASGANTAATMMSSLRIIIAPHTTITAPSTMRARTSSTAGLPAAVTAVAERILVPI